MDFAKSQTRLNLARAFAGESQARQRYTIYARTARKEHQEYLARLLEETAANEQVHARLFLEQLHKHGGTGDNIDLEAGYPFQIGSTLENLKAAAEGEGQEFSDVYPAFAQTAEEEGFADVARLFRQIAQIEGLHQNVFRQAENQLREETLYQKQQPVVWRCANCGYSVKTNGAPERCPVCSEEQGWFQGDINQKQLPDSQ